MLLRAVVVVLYVFLLAPIAIVVLAAFNAGSYLTFPPQGLSVHWFDGFLHSRAYTRSFLFSIQLAAVATITSTVLGTAAALYVARFRGPLLGLVRLLLIAPLPVPGILTGIALLIFFYAIGLGNRGFLPLLVGHTLICLPYVFLVVAAVLVSFDQTLEEAARSLGAGAWTTFRRVTLPLIKGGVISGATFAFIVSFDEFNVSLLLKGVGTTPLPIQISDDLRFSFEPTAAVAGTISILMALVVVLLTQWLVGLDSIYGSAR